MKTKLKEYLKETNIKIKEIKYLKDYIIICDINNNKYLLTEKNNTNILKELKKVDFLNYQENINKENDNYQLYKYYDDNNIDKYEKLKALTRVLKSLHRKTLLYEEISIEEYNNIYNKINNQIEELIKYYLDIHDYIEEYPYLRIDYLFLIKNISMIHQILLLSKRNLDNWYKEKKIKIRKCYIIGSKNNLDNFRICEKNYFIDYGTCHKDLLIYDLVFFYKNEIFNFTNNDIHELYKDVLLEEEKNLFYSLICIPGKLEFSKDMYENTVRINNVLEYISRTNMYMSEENKEN